MNYRQRLTSLLREVNEIERKCLAENRDITPDEAERISEIRSEGDEIKSKIELESTVRRMQESYSAPFGGSGNSATGLAFALKSVDWTRQTPSVTVPRETVIGAKDFAGPDQDELNRVQGPFIELGLDRRFLFPNLPGSALGTNLAVVDYKQSTASSLGSGSTPIERSPMDVTEKAELDVSVEQSVEEVRQLAIMVRDVPNAVLDQTGAASFDAFINGQLRFRYQSALDTHVIAQIDAASPDSGGTGADSIGILRNAVGAMRDKGMRPSIAALNPTDAANLDLTTTGADNAYLFPLRDTGNSSPLFGLRFIEVPSINPGTVYLIDPQQAMTVYTGDVSLLSDPYSGFSRNTTDLRLEGNVLGHVRNIQGVFVVMLGS
jgi:hypothetical protein